MLFDEFRGFRGVAPHDLLGQGLEGPALHIGILETGEPFRGLLGAAGPDQFADDRFRGAAALALVFHGRGELHRGIDVRARQAANH